MLTAGGALVSDLGDAIARDPEVRQARMIADAARTRLVASMTGPQDEIDLVEAQGMLDALRNAQALAGDAEDRVLVHRGLLTSAAADKRAARRRPFVARSDSPARAEARRGVRGSRFSPVSRLQVPAAASRLGAPRPGGRRPGGRRNAARVIAGLLALALLGVIGATLAERYGIRLPLASRRS